MLMTVTMMNSMILTKMPFETDVTLKAISGLGMGLDWKSPGGAMLRPTTVLITQRTATVALDALKSV